jgi:hypothetical protein
VFLLTEVPAVIAPEADDRVSGMPTLVERFDDASDLRVEE